MAALALVHTTVANNHTGLGDGDLNEGTLTSFTPRWPTIAPLRPGLGASRIMAPRSPSRTAP